MHVDAGARRSGLRGDAAPLAETFLTRVPEVRALGFDEIFVRMRDFDLAIRGRLRHPLPRRLAVRHRALRLTTSAPQQNRPARGAHRPWSTTDVAAIVTGGASGLGGATVRAWPPRAPRVAIDLPQAVDTAEKLERVDLRRRGRHRRRPGAGRGRRRGRAPALPLRIVVNCAGIGTAGRVLSKKGPHDLGPVPQVIERQPDRHVQRHAAGRRGDRRDRAARGRRARRRREHRVGGRLRGPGRPDRLLRVEGRRGRHDRARGPRPGPVRHPGDDHRARHHRHPDAGRRHRGVPRAARRRASRSPSGSAAPTSTPSSSR